MDRFHLSNDRHLTFHYTLIQCCYNLIYCCVIYFASVYLLFRGFTNTQIGITLMTANGLSILLQPLIANFADKSKNISLQRLLGTIVLFTGVFSILLFLMPTPFAPTAILYVLTASLAAAQTALLTSISMEHINHGANLNFSLARGFGSLAFSGLALIMGNLVARFDAWVIMPISAGISLIYLFLVLRFPKPSEFSYSNDLIPTSEKADASSKALSLFDFARKYRKYMLFLGSAALMLFSHVLINTYTIQIIEHVGGDSADMGIASALAAVLELPAMALFPFFLRRLKSAGLILKLSGVAFVLKAVITLFAPNMFWIYVAQCFQFFSFALYVPASVYYANRIIRGVDKVKGQSVTGLAISISGMLGNLLGGYMLDHKGGVTFMLTVGCVVSGIGLFLMLVLAPKDREFDD